jgi:hypothetical protein
MYTIQYFIDKFSAIPEDQWCSRTQINASGQRCAYGHCAPAGLTLLNFSNGAHFPEGAAFAQLDKTYFPCEYFQFADINNGEDLRFQQPTEKERVLAALQWCKEQEAQALIAKALTDPDEEEDDDDELDEDDQDYRINKTFTLEVERRPKESALS